ncbi:MAG: UvrD-helicase domain-containing protein [Candidatus Pacebacteria bacterium]|nr:UvrD-helicase domain-containing protein [Candidatus Paceibacterota bacterium]
MLNSQQKEASLHMYGPILILAGAGAGKTKTIVHRIENLIKEGTAPHQILAITFTNKAAKEMRERVLNILTDKREAPFVSTFHSLGVNILKEQHKVLGIPRHFGIYDKSDAKRAIKEAVEACDLDPKQFDPAKFQNTISREKGNFVTLEQYTEKASEYFEEMTAKVWTKYEETLKKEKAFDFDDLLLKTAVLLQKNKEVREYYQNRWKFIHIDEYQDTNKVQYMIATLLSEKEKNLCVVGDIDQNIYSWRGADIQNILNFEKDYPDAKVILLEENYRSTQRILDVANEVIKKNKQRREKNLFTKNEEGDKVTLFESYDENEEARTVIDEAYAVIDKGVKPDEIAVLYRANFQSRILEEYCLRKGVPYQVLGTKFFERKEVKDVISYIKAALNPENVSDMVRVINTPVRGIGKVTVAKVVNGEEATLPKLTQIKVQEFKNLLVKIKEFALQNKPSDTIKFILFESRLEKTLRDGTADDQERLENIKELVTVATKYDSMPPEEAIEKFLTEAALASDQDELQVPQAGIKLMTVHASKGLEFDYVFIVGLEQGLFPHDEDGEEERRLFYVALTRARKKIYLSWAQIRTIFGAQRVNMASEFIDDVPSHHIDIKENEVPTGVKAIFIDF